MTAQLVINILQLQDPLIFSGKLDFEVDWPFIADLDSLIEPLIC